MAPQYFTWSKCIHIIYTHMHSQVQEHLLCKYEINQSAVWQFLAHAHSKTRNFKNIIHYFLSLPLLNIIKELRPE